MGNILRNLGRSLQERVSSYTYRVEICLSQYVYAMWKETLPRDQEI